jgi:amidohydrolase
MPKPQEPVESLKERVCEAVDALTGTLLDVSHEIHANPELAFEERHASALLVRTLEAAGLSVETGAYGLETAFCSDFSGTNSDAGCVALLAEYDALPGIGHACGHNLIATAGVGAGLALNALGDALPGRVRILGTPAEERGGGKELMARQGAFEGVDAAMMIHPAGVNLVDMPSIAVADVTATYRGEAAHASAMPERGRNALDGLVTAYQAIGALRQHIRQSERIHGIFTNGGQAPNIVPEIAEGRFFVRARDAKALAPLKERVIACFEAGATASGTRVELEWSPVDYEQIRFNEPLASAFQQNAERLGREFLPLDAMPAHFAGSTDMGNISHRVPSIHPMLAAAPPHCAIHNAEFALHAGAEIGDAAALDGAKALAMTALDFLCDADLRERSRNLFEAFGV